MNFSNLAEICSSGMQVEQTRMDVAALNLANVNSIRGSNGVGYVPLGVSVSTKSVTPFSYSLSGLAKQALPEANIYQQHELPKRMVLDPNNPYADRNGYVSYSGVDSVTEMLNLTMAARRYEANVVALNAAKSMYLKALEIGGGA